MEFIVSSQLEYSIFLGTPSLWEVLPSLNECFMNLEVPLAGMLPLYKVSSAFSIQFQYFCTM